MSNSINPITMPKLGLSMTEGSVAAWHVEPGAEIAAGDLIADIETSKITNELEAHVDGIFRRATVDVGTEVPVGALIGIVADEDVTDSAIDEFVAGFSPEDSDGDEDLDKDSAESDGGRDDVEQVAEVSAERSLAADDVAPALAGSYDPDTVFATHHAHKLAQRSGIDLQRVSGSGRGGRISKRDVETALQKAGAGSDSSSRSTSRTRAAAVGPGNKIKTTPAARRLADEHDVELADVPATGSRGRVSKGDVLTYLEKQGSGTATGTGADQSLNEPVDEEPLDAARKSLARRLSESKRNAPHFRLTIDVKIDNLLELRRDIQREDGDMSVSVTDMLVRASGLALADHPDVNIQFDGEVIKRYAHVDISVAVALERGLMTPVVRNADTKTLSTIAREMAKLTEKARAGSLSLDDISGGTFTLSNLGMFGIKSFDAIINPPQAAIAAIGQADRRYFVDGGETPRVGTFTTVTLSCDHRVIDGATGARFLQSFKDILEHPGRLLL